MNSCSDLKFEIGHVLFIDIVALATAYTSLGEKERAIEALEHGFAEGNKSYLFLLPGDPFLDDLRGDPRFEALVQKITHGK